MSVCVCVLAHCAVVNFSLKDISQAATSSTNKYLNILCVGRRERVKKKDREREKRTERERETVSECLCVFSAMQAPHK